MGTTLFSLFGERGACGGCWCMLWRLTRKQYELQKGVGNKLAMKAIVDSGEVPGILAYHNTEAIGWCAIALRKHLFFFIKVPYTSANR